MTKIEFVKSSFSGGNGGECVEWAHTAAGVHVRDSKNRDGPQLFYTHAAWNALVANAAPTTTEVKLTAQNHELTFTAAEWNAFTAAAQAGECHPAPSATP